MSFTMFVTWVIVGVLAGLLAGVVMKRGGYGLKKDIILGLVGGIGASWIFRALGVFPGAGIVAMHGRRCRRGGHPASSLNASFGPPSGWARTGPISGGGGGWAQRSWPWWHG